MAYISATEYAEIYAETPPSFERLAFNASRLMDNETSGVDGYKKLRTAFPTDPDDATAVKHCAADLVNFLHLVDQLGTRAVKALEYTAQADGTIRGNVVESVSSGSESVTYANNPIQSHILTAAANDAERRRMCRDIIREHLAGVCDANGVHLLYAGVYPYVR